MILLFVGCSNPFKSTKIEGFYTGTKNNIVTIKEGHRDITIKCSDKIIKNLVSVEKGTKIILTKRFGKVKSVQTQDATQKYSGTIDQIQNAYIVVSGKQYKVGSSVRFDIRDNKFAIGQKVNVYVNKSEMANFIEVQN